MEIQRTGTDGQPVSGIEWDSSVTDDTGKSTQLITREVGLGRYALQVPLDTASQLTLRIRDTDHGKQRVLTYNRPYPIEYRLNTSLPPELEALSTISPDSIRDGIDPVRLRKSISHWFSLAALACLLGSILLRRI